MEVIIPLFYPNYSTLHIWSLVTFLICFWFLFYHGLHFFTFWSNEHIHPLLIPGQISPFLIKWYSSLYNPSHMHLLFDFKLHPFFFKNLWSHSFAFWSQFKFSPFWSQIPFLSFLSPGHIPFLFDPRSHSFPFWSRVAFLSFLISGHIPFLFDPRSHSFPFWSLVTFLYFLIPGHIPFLFDV